MSSARKVGGEAGGEVEEHDSAAPGEARRVRGEAERAIPSEVGRGSGEAERLLSRPALHARDRQAPPAGVVRARVVGADPEGRPLVSFEHGPPLGIPAAAVWFRDAPDWSACSGLEVVIGFEHGDEARPIVLGLLEAPPDGARADRGPGGKPKSLTIESSNELVFVCGQSKIILRADGSLTILGEKVVSRARTVNKIKGGSVQIN